MNTYSKNGYRKSIVAKNKLVKKHTRGFYKTLDLINEVANELDKLNVDITEDNIDSLSRPILGRDLDSMEKLLILGRLSKPELNETKNNIN